MTEYRNQISGFAAVLFFFFGGLLSFNRDIITLILNAFISGFAGFTAVFLVMTLAGAGQKRDTLNTIQDKPGKENRGRSVDITAGDDSLFKDVYKK